MKIRPLGPASQQGTASECSSQNLSAATMPTFELPVAPAPLFLCVLVLLLCRANGQERPSPDSNANTTFAVAIAHIMIQGPTSTQPLRVDAVLFEQDTHDLHVLRERGNTLCTLIGSTEHECRIVHAGLSEAAGRFIDHGPRVFGLRTTIPRDFALEHMLGEHHGRHFFHEHKWHKDVEIAHFDIYRRDSVATLLARHCETDHCHQYFRKRFLNREMGPLFTQDGKGVNFTHAAAAESSRLVQLCTPALPHKAQLPQTYELITEGSRFGFVQQPFEQTVSAAWNDLVKAQTGLAWYLKHLQQNNGWQFEHDFYEEGSVSEWPQAAQILLRAAMMSKPQTVCEIGFNTGHSALMWLYSGASKVIAFDICRHPYTQRAAEYIDKFHAGDVHLVKGNSTLTVRQFAEENQDVQCDIAFIDGDHNYGVPFLDLQALRQLSHKKTLVVMDDVNCNADWCGFPDRAWQQAQRDGSMVELQCVAAHDIKHGLCFGQYLYGHDHGHDQALLLHAG